MASFDAYGFCGSFYFSIITHKQQTYMVQEVKNIVVMTAAEEAIVDLMVLLD